MKYWIGKAEVSTLVLILKNYFNEVMHLSGIRSKSIKRKANIHFYQISKIIKLKFSFHPPTLKDANGFEEIFFLMQGFSVRQFSARILIYIKAIYPAMSFPSSRKKKMLLLAVSLSTLLISVTEFISYWHWHFIPSNSLRTGLDLLYPILSPEQRWV